jgi:phosphatidylglycerophosphate synthase
VTAEERLDLTRAKKPIDAWWTVFVIDPIAVRLLPAFLAFGWVTPNLVTGAAFAVGGVAVALFGTGHFALAAVVYEFRFLLDCLDGKIARVRRLSSPLGATLDRTADSITVPAAYAALGIALAHRHGLAHTWSLLPALMACLTSGMELSLELFLSKMSTGDGGTSTPEPAGLRARLARHRLRLLPWTVEAEAVGLFIAPLALHHHALGVAELVVAAVYAVFCLVDFAEMVRAGLNRP